jgi:glycosyltransferase involved in cell wall biosynthesis
MGCSVSIIIATSSRHDSLRETLESLCSIQVPEKFSVELLLVENGVQSGIEESLSTLPKHSFSIRYIFLSAAGKSRALNMAVKEAKGDILLFTDDDVRFPLNWLSEMCTPLARGEGSVVVGGCRLAPHLLRDWMKPYHRSFLASTEYLSDGDPSEFAGVNVACLREVFSKVPEFDPELGAAGPPKGEDALFARQLKLAGCVFVSRTNVCVEHHPMESRLSYANWIRAAVSAGRSRAYILYHWDHAKIRFVHVRLIYLAMKLYLRLLLTGKRPLDAEGIPPWELSYRQDITKLQCFIDQRRRQRNYTFHGLRYLDRDSERLPV